MVGRVLLLIAAFVVAGLGALLVYLYAQQSNERALAQYDAVSAVVVQGPVAVGTSVAAAVDQGLLTVESLPGANVPVDAVPDLAEVADLVVLADLYDGETLVRSRVGEPAAATAFDIPDGMLALSFAFDDPQRVANYVRPQSEIAVLLTYNPPATGTAGGTDLTDGGDPGTQPAPVDASIDGRTTRVLLDRVEVLAVGSTTASPVVTDETGAETAPAPVSQTILTLALTKEQAEGLVLAQDIGSLYLGLVDDQSLVEPGPGADVDSLFEVVVE